MSRDRADPASETVSADGRQPLVSVLLPVHNGERYLAAAIESILRQTYGRFELIVIDDGSTDGSAAIATRCADPRVVVVRNERNLGLVATLNNGLALAKGEFLARMDADDVADPRRLELQLARFQSNPRLAAIGSGIRYIDAEGRPGATPGRLAVGPAVLRWRLLRGTCLYHPTLMVHRARAANDAHYSDEFPHAEDYELLLRLSRHHDLDNVAEPLLAQRVHDESVSRRFRDEQRDSAARALVAHLRLQYGLDEAVGPARALLDLRHYFTSACRDQDSPIPLILRLERLFREREPGLVQADVRVVRRDVAFFLWKAAAIALADWNGGALIRRRSKMLAACAGGLLARPISAIRALAWR